MEESKTEMCYSVNREKKLLLRSMFGRRSNEKNVYKMSSFLSSLNVEKNTMEYE
jgi:hypothetical protein